MKSTDAKIACNCRSQDASRYMSLYFNYTTEEDREVAVQYHYKISASNNGPVFGIFNSQNAVLCSCCLYAIATFNHLSSFNRAMHYVHCTLLLQ